MTDRLELYRTRALIRRHGGHRWRYVATNGHVLADSGESYSRRIDALAAAARVLGVDGRLEPGKVYTRADGRPVRVSEAAR